MKIILTKLLLTVVLFSATALYAQTPSWQWGKRGGTETDGPNGFDNVIDMAMDQNGNVYVLTNNAKGTFVNIDGHQGASYYDMISVSSWDCSGNFRWMKTYGGPSVSAVALRTDSLGGIYVAGSVFNSISGQGPSGPAHLGDTILPYTDKTMFLLKYDTMGTLEWLKMPQPDTISITSASYGGIYDMDVSPDGDIFLYCLLTPGNYDNNAFIVSEMKMYVLRYNAGGVFESLTPLDITVSGTWQQGYGYANLGGSNTKFSRDNHNGRYYLAGTYNPDFGSLIFGTTPVNATGNIGSQPMYLAAFDSNGNNLWVRQGSPDKGSGVFSRPVIDNLGNVYIGGSAQPTAAFGGYTFTNNNQPYGVPFIIAVDSNGNNIWATNGNTIALSRVNGLSVNISTIGASGFYAGPIQWDSIEKTSSNATFIFLARLNATTGQLTGLDSIASNSLQTYASSIAADKNNNFYIGGQFSDQLYPAGDTLTNSGGMYDWFIAKFGTANCNCDIPQPSFSYNNNGDNSYSFNYTGSTPYSDISWDFGDGASASNTANPTHIYTSSGTYNICVTVTNGCGSNISCQTLQINDEGIAVVPGFTDMSIYPNPTREEIIIDHAETGMVLDIYNTLGQQVLHRVLKGEKEYINVSSLPSGIYLIHFRDKAGRTGNGKFVKQ